MSYNINDVAKAMKDNVGGNPEKVTHFVRVYTLAKSIGELEGLPENLQRQLERGDIWTASASGVDSGGAARGP